MSFDERALNHRNARVLNQDWPSIDLDFFLSLMYGRWLWPNINIQFSHGGAKANVKTHDEN